MAPVDFGSLLSRSPLQVCGFVCLSRFWGASLPCNLSSLIGPKKANDFQSYHLFHITMMCYDFQILYMLELKLEVFFYNIKIGGS